MVEEVPRRLRTRTLCELCAKNKGPVNTHNTDKYRRYNSDCSKKYHKSKSSGDKKTLITSLSSLLRQLKEDRQTFEAI